MNTTFSIKETYKEAWVHVKGHFWFFVLSTFIFFVLNILLNLADNGIAAFILGIASGIVGLLFQIGFAKIGLMLDTGGIPKAEHFKSEVNLVITVFLASIIIAIFTMFGFILLVVPGIIVAIRLSMTIYIILDKKLSAWEAVKESWRITKGFGWKLFGYMMLAIVIVIVSIIPIGLGLLVSLPLIYITQALIYKKISKIKSGEIPSVTTG